MAAAPSTFRSLASSLRGRDVPVFRVQGVWGPEFRLHRAQNAPPCREQGYGFAALTGAAKLWLRLRFTYFARERYCSDVDWGAGLHKPCAMRGSNVRIGVTCQAMRKCTLAANSGHKLQAYGRRPGHRRSAKRTHTLHFTDSQI